MHLSEDIRNSISHVFGEHDKCDKYFCVGPKLGEENYIEDMKQTGLFQVLWMTIFPSQPNSTEIMLNSFIFYRNYNMQRIYCPVRATASLKTKTAIWQRILIPLWQNLLGGKG